MKSLGEIFRGAKLERVKIGPRWLKFEVDFQDVDKDAAWELYIELLTRITTQELGENDGDEETALKSIFALFALTREVLKRKGRGATKFALVAIPVLNQVVRPFTARWHRMVTSGEIEKGEVKTMFRRELRELQSELRNYNTLLAEIAEVENLTDLEG